MFKPLVLSTAGALFLTASLLAAEPAETEGQAPPAAADEQPAAPVGDPVATVNGEPVDPADVTITADERKTEQRLYELRVQAANNAVSQTLLRKEAERRGLTDSNELFQIEIVPKVGVPTNKDVNDFYKEQKDRINRPLEEVRDQLIDVIQETKARVHLVELVASLRAEADVRINIEPPRLPVDLTDVRSIGPADAAVTVVEYSDFQCPYCEEAQPTLKELRELYKDRIRWVFKDLPLVDIHPEARKAAQAARCADAQGKFWQFRDKLYEQELFTDATYETVAKDVGVNAKKLITCLTEGETAEAVAKEEIEGRSFGIEGTPSFLINGILVTGARPLESFQEIIDRELEAVEASP